MKFRKKAGVLALAATASMAVAGVGVSTSQAALLTACTGQNITGEGSSLQRAAQGVWVTRFNTNTNGGCTVSGRTPSVTYNTTSSGRFMNKWSAGGGTFDTTVHFGGTDDAPTSTQITNINAGSRSSVLSIPVAQAAIAIVVNPPAGCSISSITPADLEGVFRGSITTWAGISGTSGCGTSTITRVVRNDSSGTTYQLKHYLGVQNTAAVCSASGRTTTTWAGLQDPSLNQVWPSVCDAYPSTGVKYSQAGGTSGRNDGSGGGDEAKTVINTTGSIGYVALSDARAQYTGTNNYKWIGIRTSSRNPAIDPSTNGLSTTKAFSNCTTTAGAYGTTLPAATASWSGVYLTTPGTAYPLCTLTWDLTQADYSRAFGSAGQSIATTVHDYLNYVNLTRGGVADALVSPNANDYAALPSGGGSGDVQAAAASGISQIVD